MASSPPPDSLLLHRISTLRFLLVFLCLLSISSSPVAANADPPAASVSGSPDDSDSPAPANHVGIMTVVAVVILAELISFIFGGRLLLACRHYVKDDHQKRARNTAIWVIAGVHVLVLSRVLAWVIK